MNDDSPQEYLTAEEIRDESRGLDRYTLQVFPVTDYGHWVAGERILIPAVGDHREEIVEQFGKYFHRETHFDFAPYRAGKHRMSRTYLITAPRVLRLLPVAVGAVEMAPQGEKFQLAWMWLHPLFRGKRDGIARRVWDELTQDFGKFTVQPPITRAMRGLLTAVGSPEAGRRLRLGG